MAEMMSFKLFAEPFDKMTVEAGRTSDRVTRYALRQVGRQVAKAARAKAPKYTVTKGSKTARGSERKPFVDQRALAESGNLKKSIKNRKRMERGG